VRVDRQEVHERRLEAAHPPEHASRNSAQLQTPTGEGP
jgi:hypothetical protein